MPRKLEFIAGQRFGKRTILGETSHLGRTRIIKCVCDCGTIKRVNMSTLSQGKSKSCGCGICIHNNSGKHRTKLYVTYTNMLQRCNNPKHKSYKNYGGKGIKCEWNSFNEFLIDMGESYENHVRKYGEHETTIDRVNSNGNYCKENCRWATHLEQSNNLSSNRSVTYKGKKYKTLASLCREYGIGVTTMNQRINKYGWSLEKAIETQIQIHKKH